ncbi:sporulation integral membrane protein YlbJ [Anaerobacillus isosaccharinicus]|uniref:Sporulation integral membrane protein YlbJ n=2 Tax=Anaerobacillus isosaccharinicus TaxID=1532552 RepID=A0A7S7R9Y6_9BACI|nr:sporulation integral membrane protein YlbJ [Anaerobacillus isosaccharinicus]MBA5587459.1 sporulation integral membrane protein YlbJ [Anaerobacillus isosaccharinicus]QOY34356.1 sporulation integral membrane protein YlbJ [Anaerobacillus isosaccharinicus]
MNASKLKTIILAMSATIMAASLMVFPKESFEASMRGLTMWWEVVFPSLLPFFIVSEFLIGFGVVSFLGSLLEPLMRPLFRVPGVGGFVWAMGLASGYPAGAKLTARLRQENKLTVIEAERLVSFTNSSNPLFIFGAIAVGFFHNPALGIVLALSHYLGNICVGLLMRFHGRKREETVQKDKQNKLSLRAALHMLHQERLKDGRPIGKILGDAVQSSVSTLLMIGGFIILFSVLNRLLSLLDITTFLSLFVTIILAFFQIPNELSLPLLSGIFEITLGSQMASQTGAATLFQQVIVTSFILAFSGFSVQAQVASILAETDISFKPFFIARLFHGVFAAIFTVLLWKPLYVNQQILEKGSNAIPVFFQAETYLIFEHSWNLLLTYGPLVTLISLMAYVILTLKKLTY